MARRRKVPAQRRTTEVPGAPDPTVPEATASRYDHLPPPVRREDLRTSQDVLAHADEVGEADRERAWLLRTTGLFL